MTHNGPNDLHPPPNTGGNDIPPNGAPVWIPIVGAVFAAATLGFIAFVIVKSADNIAYLCVSFTFFIPFFALGLGLSAAFFGGWAAAEGRLGAVALGHSLAFSAGGGAAVVIIMYFVMHSFAPSPNDPRCSQVRYENTISIRNIPRDARIETKNWYQRRNTTSSNSFGNFDLEVLLYEHTKESVSKNEIDFQYEISDGEHTTCTVHIFLVKDVSNKDGIVRLVGQGVAPTEFDETSFAGAPNATRITHTVDFQSNAGDSGSGIVCLRRGDQTVRTIFHNGSGRKLFFSRELEFSELALQVSSHDAVGRWLTGLRSLATVGIALASGIAYNMPYEELRKLLESDDPNVRVEARRFLSAEFRTYASQAITDVFDSTSSPELVTGLLHGLSVGIDQATEGALTPGRKRDLTIALPYAEGREFEIFRLIGNEDESVQKQARRLIQRYPVDAFKEHAKKALGAAEAGNCNIYSVADEEGIFHGVIFYEYNRIIDTIYRDDKLTEDAMSVIDDKVSRIKSAIKQCVSDANIATDAAVLDYGRALAYMAVSRARARQAAKDFLAHLRGRENLYYYKPHIVRIKEMV